MQLHRWFTGDSGEIGAPQKDVRVHMSCRVPRALSL